MLKHLITFIKFMIPILGKSMLQASADTLTEVAYNGRPRRRGVLTPYASYNRMAQRPYPGVFATDIEDDEPEDMPVDIARNQDPFNMTTFDPSEAVEGDSDFLEPHLSHEGRPYHDVIMVAFDVSGLCVSDVHGWLLEQMPIAGEHVDGQLYLDDYWVADDSSFDDRDSAVFVGKGNQRLARDVLRRERLTSS